MMGLRFNQPFVQNETSRLSPLEARREHFKEQLANIRNDPGQLIKKLEYTKLEYEQRSTSYNKLCNSTNPEIKKDVLEFGTKVQDRLSQIEGEISALLSELKIHGIDYDKEISRQNVTIMQVKRLEGMSLVDDTGRRKVQFRSCLAKIKSLPKPFGEPILRSMVTKREHTRDELMQQIRIQELLHHNEDDQKDEIQTDIKLLGQKLTNNNNELKDAIDALKSYKN